MSWSEMGVYRDREEAGERLASALQREPGVCEGPGDNRVVVLAAPRGGVAVAVPIARALKAPLDLVLARKLPAPGNPELGFGAIGEGGVRVMDEEVVELLGLSKEEIDEIADRVENDLEERARRYRERREALPLEGTCAIVVDDGVATGVTLTAAVASARQRGARRVVATAPVSSAEAEARVAEAADRFICPVIDTGFVGVGAYYRDFPQLTDEEVVRLLESVR